MAEQGQHLKLHNHCLKTGRFFEMCRKPEDLPRSSTIIQSFRVKGMECKSCKAFIFLYAVVGVPTKHIFQEAVTKKIFQK
jgi:hypothetical protein